MRRLQYIALAAAIFGVACNSTGKKPASNTTRDSTQSPFWNDAPTAKDRPSTLPTISVDGMLAGLLIDPAGRPMANTVINVSPADAGGNAKPIGIQTDDQGYFTIKGLNSGTYYLLATRADVGGRPMTASTITQASNTRMLIKLSESATPSAPMGAPSAPSSHGTSAPEPKGGKTKLEAPSGSVPSPEPVPKDSTKTEADGAFGPGRSPPVSRPFNPPPPASPNMGNGNVADFVVNPPPPTANISSPRPTPKVEPPPSPNSSTMSATPSNYMPPMTPPTQVEDRRPTFNVYDLAGEKKEFRELSERRLIVLDFWATTCGPCLRKIPELIELQSRYSEYISIAGIACDDAPWAARKKAVEGIKNSYLRRAPKPINYHLYLEGEGQEGRVQQLFKVRAYPTMVLLDHSGRELWRGSDVRLLTDAINYYLQRR